MINFRLLGYPVRIEWMFWLICGVLGMNLLKVPGQEGIIMMMIWVGVVFFSILWHEFGHAFARKKFREPYSEIVLHGFGGYCAGPGNFTRQEQMFVSFAGPLASFILGGIVYFGFKMFGVAHPMVGFFIAQMLWVNIGWAIINLLPVYPLDGGQIFAAYMSNKKPSIVPIVGMVVAGAVAAYGLIFMNSLWMAILFGMLAFQNWQRSQGGRPTRFF
ncbi:MAG: site-2 protease family protein [Verrucomicrobiales bacterium]|nr:site-2 protease family protein [Verrucomicrobiales bacterium]